MGPLLKFVSPVPCSLTIITTDLRPRQYMVANSQKQSVQLL